MRVKAIISRFGENIVGGAEKHCLDILRILPKDWDIEVLTTTAKDYITWKNEFKQGTYTWENLRISRYQVDKKRNITQFNEFTDRIRDIYPSQSLSMEKDWLEEQGPYSPKLIEAIQNAEKDADFFLFFSYLYYPTVVGLESIQKKSVIIPMLHDEFPAYLSIYKNVLKPSLWYAFNSPEEMELFETIYGYKPRKSIVVGTFVSQQKSIDEFVHSEESPSLPASSDSYTLCIGRMDLGKGIRELVEMYTDWFRQAPIKIPLKIIGSNPPSVIKEMESSAVEFLGYVQEEEKANLLKKATCLINPSAMESFSIVVMESWAQGTPVLVNSQSSVLKGHCRRSNGGLYYSDWESFNICMDTIVSKKELSKKLGENGRKYVSLNFTEDVIRRKLLGLFQDVVINS